MCMGRLCMFIYWSIRARCCLCTQSQRGDSGRKGWNVCQDIVKMVLWGSRAGWRGLGGFTLSTVFFVCSPPPLSFFLFPFFFPSKEGCLFFHFNLQVINFSRTYLMETRRKKKTWKQTINNYVNHCTWEQLNSSACFRLFLLFSFSFFLFPINQVLWFANLPWLRADFSALYQLYHFHCYIVFLRRMAFCRLEKRFVPNVEARNCYK